MNARYNMIIIKGEIKTREVVSCRYNRDTKKWDVEFNNGKKYSYGYLNVQKLKDPQILNPKMYRISRDGREFFNIKAIYVFTGKHESYWHICFNNGSTTDYRQSDLDIVESCFNHKQSANVFEYLKQIAALNDIKNEETNIIKS